MGAVFDDDGGAVVEFVGVVLDFGEGSFVDGGGLEVCGEGCGVWEFVVVGSEGCAE